MGPRHFLFAASRKETIGGLLRPMYFHAPPSTPLVGKKLLLTPYNLPDVHKLHAGPPSAAQAFGRYGQQKRRTSWLMLVACTKETATHIMVDACCLLPKGDSLIHE